MNYRYPASTGLLFTAALLLAHVGCAFSARVKQEGQTLTSCNNPTLVLQIDPLFKPLESLTFPLDSLSDVDRRLFVDAIDGGTIRRLVIVQFETVRPGATFRFLYPAKPPAQFGAETYRFNAYVHDDEADAVKSPAREAGRTRNFLVAQGFTVPRLFRIARLARVSNQDGMSEIIILYMENADADFPSGPLDGADEDGDLNLDTFAAQAMLTRLKSVVVPGSD